MWKARIVAPKTARKGEVVEIKAMISHPMETGYRHDAMGKIVERDIIKRMTVNYAGAEVFAMECYTGVAANPFVSFTTVATETSDLVFTWTDEKGAAVSETVHLVVT